MTISDHPDLVTALLSVPGVAAAEVEPLGGGPGTLRLQLVSGADEVDVAGAVNRLLRSRFGLAVDADRVRVLEGSGPVPSGPAGTPEQVAPEQVAPEQKAPEQVAPEQVAPEQVAPEQVAEQEAPVPVPEPPVESRPGHEPGDGADPAVPVDPVRAATGRLVIERVQLVSAGFGVTVAVSLRSGDRTVVGEAEGPATPSALHRSVAEATLRAVEAVVDEQVRFAVEHVEIATTGEERTALVVVSMLTERATQRLSGASVVREDVRQAVVRSVLAAVNRRVEPMLVTAQVAD